MSLPTRNILAAAVSAALLLGLGACSPATESQSLSVQKAKAGEADRDAGELLAPGAPGLAPTWAFAGKTGIGTSYEAYADGHYQDTQANPVSRVWFSLAQGIVTETMFGLIHNAQLKELQFVIQGKDFVDTEKDNTISSIEYLQQDDAGRPQSLAYKIINKDIEGKYQIEKHIFTDPDRDSLMMRVTFTAFEDGITPYLYVNPHIDNSGANDIASVEGKALIAHTAATDSSVLSVRSDVDFVKAQVGFVGVSDGLKQLQSTGALTHWYQSTSPADNSIVGNVAMTAQYPSLSPSNGKASLSVNLVLGFGKDKASSLASANASLNAGYAAVLAAYKGDDKHQGWSQYLASLTSLPAMAQNTADEGKLLYTSAMVLKAQEDKTHAGALIASLSNPWGDTVSAEVGSTGYKAVWPRDFYQCAMAFLAMGDTQTPRVAFEYLKQVQAGAATPGYSGTPGWFLQKTHVDGETEWVGVQLDQTAMPIMLGWKLWQAGVLSQDEISGWYAKMLKPAADFLVKGGEVNLDWNHSQITPPKTQQERWEEQAGYSPSTTAAVISGLIAAGDIAKQAKDPQGAADYLSAARGLEQNLETLMVTHTGLLTQDGKPAAPYYLRLSPDGLPDGDAKLAANNGKAALDQRLILDAGMLELVRYGVRNATDPLIRNTLALIDDTSLEPNLRLKYEFLAKDGSTIPGFRRYGNDGYGEDARSGNNYAEGGSNTQDQRGRVWPFFTGERGHYELALAKAEGKLNEEKRQQLIRTYVQGMESFANAGLMLPEQVWDGVGNPSRYQYVHGQGTNSATPLAWTHAEYVKLVRSMTDASVWDNYPVVSETLAK